MNFVTHLQVLCEPDWLRSFCWIQIKFHCIWLNLARRCSWATRFRESTAYFSNVLNCMVVDISRSNLQFYLILWKHGTHSKRQQHKYGLGVLLDTAKNKCAGEGSSYELIVSKSITYYSYMIFVLGKWIYMYLSSICII